MKIAYLAPENPSLTATFVYNEIFKLEEMGMEVVPFSVHNLVTDFDEARVQDLKQRSYALYTQSKLAVLKDNVYILLKNPFRYLRVFVLLCSDIWRVGIFSRTALGLGYRYFFAASFARRLTEKNCVHLHVHFAHVPTDIAMYASCFSGIPFSVTAHANDIFERGWLLAEKVQRAAFFATISEFNKCYLASIGVDVEKVCIVRCGVDPTQFVARLNFISGSHARIGVVGRLVEKKGIDTLIKAVAELKQRGTKLELLIAGSGPLENDLQELSKKNGLTQTDVQFLGVMAHTEVAEFIKSLDVFVLPCKQDSHGDMDGIPVVLMEAMLSGVPVISTKLSGIPELVIDKETGLLAQPENVESLVGAISCMLNGRDLRSKMINKAIFRVSEEFSLLGNAEKLKAMFSSIVN